MPFRVLSLDGGGAWALIEVRTLIKLYGADTAGHDVLKNFDLVAANSAGSLVLAGLVENLTLSEIVQYFLDDNKRKSLFSPTTKPDDAVVRGLLGIGPRFSAAAKLPAIERLLPSTGDAPLAGCTTGIIGPGGMPVHLLIVGFDYDTNRAVFFRSAPAGGKEWGDGQPADVSLAGAVHASTNAPVNYFDEPAALPMSPDRYWDGGVTGCNNPALVAVVEATVLGHANDINVLSLGTASISLPLAPLGAPALPLEAPRSSSSLPNDLKKLAGAILDDPPDAATFIAHAMTGGASGVSPPVVSRVVRMSPLISPLQDGAGGWETPGGWTIAAFQHLCTIDLDAGNAFDVTYIDDYCSVWLIDRAPNQPIRASSQGFDPMHPDIGYAKFSEASVAWSILFPLVTAAVA